VIGASRPTPEDFARAEAVGRGLALGGAVVVTGGRGGVMEAASKGAAEAGGLVVGILPNLDRREANPWVTVALPTGLGELRNALVARSADAVVAVAGAYGTLSEIALALAGGVPVFGLHTWEIDGVVAVDSPEAAVMAAFGAARDRRAQS
jgi:uncharacterized protein (TIGR00725 family)